MSSNAGTEPPPWTGPWADDARRLFQVLQQAVEEVGAEPGAGYEHPPECRYCPFCQGVALLRRAGPDVLDQVSEFAAGLAATLRATQPPEAGGESGESGESEPVDEAPAHRTGAQNRPPSTVRIDVTD